MGLLMRLSDASPVLFPYFKQKSNVLTNCNEIVSKNIRASQNVPCARLGRMETRGEADKLLFFLLCSSAWKQYTNVQGGSNMTGTTCV
jgi:hypothetical protein